MRAAGGRAARAADVACRGAPLQPIARSQITRVAVGSCLDQAACRTVVSTAIRCSCNLPTPTWHAQDDRGYGLPSAAPSRRSMAVFCRTPAPILGLCVPLRPPKRQRSIQTKEYNFFSTFSSSHCETWLAKLKYAFYYAPPPSQQKIFYINLRWLLAVSTIPLWELKPVCFAFWRFI